ncbi:hypothetical protein GCM10020370_08160 [Paenibacillus hodogayensis]
MFHLTPARGPVKPHSFPILAFTSLDIEMTHAALQARGVLVETIQWFPDYSSFTLRQLARQAAEQYAIVAGNLSIMRDMFPFPHGGVPGDEAGRPRRSNC